jgi:hypothetical protein
MSTQSDINANLIALGFDNSSQSALFTKTAESLGNTVDTTLTEIANSEATILTTINSKNYGKAGYYEAAALAFQYGDSLSALNPDLESVYPNIDTTKQIIKQCSATFVQTSITIKAATVDITGNTIPLSIPQYNAWVAYMRNFEIPGRIVSYVSTSANILSFVANCTYYGSYALPTIQANVTNALNLFMSTFQFNGELFINDLQDYIKSNVPGIRDFYVTQTLLDGVAFAGSVLLSAGYFNYSNTNTINYNVL